MKEEQLYQIALTLIPEIGSVVAKNLIDIFGTAEAVFHARKKELSCIEGLGEIKARCIKEFTDFAIAEKELEFLEKNRYRAIFITAPEYPRRLLQCYDAPTLLYYNGTADLNSKRIISIVGTRSNTDYGKQITEQFIEALPPQNLAIVSGLALGIDGIAHRAALQNKIATVGVLAHGLDTLYPSQHRGLSKEMIMQGGLLTEFRKNTLPDKHNFPRRNRIVAGMADATIVIETAIKGGSMITAELAFNYNRDLFALPGKITDSKSGGCLKLIQQNKANLFSGITEFLELMGWQEKKITAKKQRILFYNFTKEEAIVYELLKEQSPKAIDEIYLKSGLTSSSVASAILNLELQNIVMAMPGKRYQLME